MLKSIIEFIKNFFISDPPAFLVFVSIVTVIPALLFLVSLAWLQSKYRRILPDYKNHQDLLDKIKEKRDLICSLEKSISDLSSQNSSIFASLSTKKDSVCILERSMRELSSQNSALSTSLSTKIESCERMETSLLEKKKEIEDIDARTRFLQDLFNREESLRNQEIALIERIQNLKAQIQSQEIVLTERTQDLQRQIQELSDSLAEIQAEVDLYSRIRDYTQVGQFEQPEYFFDTSSRYIEEIKRIREDQKQLIKTGEAVDIPEEICVPDDPKFIPRVLEGQKRLMLMAFNINCDLLISKVRPSNISRTLEQIDKLASDIEKVSATLLCGFNLAFVELKMREAVLVYHNSLLLEKEAQELSLAKEQIREEAKVRAEYEREQSRLEKEEKVVLRLLDLAKSELSKVSDKDRMEAEQKIAILEAQLEEAQKGIIRAKSMAEQTKKGFVYVISNVGSFGEDVYKIGLSRRLDPSERVDELSGASVPFKFDVHAMVYSDDAPQLEYQMHNRFASKRVNVVNNRKEFFRVPLQEIHEALNEYIGRTVDVRFDAAAPEYFESLRLIPIDQ